MTLTGKTPVLVGAALVAAGWLGREAHRKVGAALRSVARKESAAARIEASARSNREAVGGWVSAPNVDRTAINAAALAYKDSHGGRNFGKAEDLVPYFQDPAVAEHFLAVAKAQHYYGEA